VRISSPCSARPVASLFIAPIPHGQTSLLALATEWERLFKETQKRELLGWQRQRGRPTQSNPIRSARNVCAHGIIPLKAFVTYLTAIAQSLGTVCHTNVTLFTRLCGEQPKLAAAFMSTRLSLICAPSASRGRVRERVADPLHRAWINAKTPGDATHTFTSALTLVQGRLDSLFEHRPSCFPSSLALLSPARTRS